MRILLLFFLLFFHRSLSGQPTQTASRPSAQTNSRAFVESPITDYRPPSSAHRLLSHNRISFRDPGSIVPDWRPFYHGVASGDPLPDRVILWTRVTPDTLEGQSIEVHWRLALDTVLQEVINSGVFVTGPERDYTVKVDVDNLQPGTTYYYGFTAMDRHSLTGRTSTAPEGDMVDHLRFGVVSCSNYQAGYFNAYRRLAERSDLDAVIHLGDYIYEYADQVYGDPQLFEERALLPQHEIVSLTDYRTRYATYRLDTNLVRAHQQHPFIAVWDDHETANNAYKDGAQNHTPGVEGDWETRKAAGKQAYYEWMPIREQANGEVYRKLSYGDLLDLFLLDTRLTGREQQITNAEDPALQDTTRTILGAAQREWLFENLTASSARWRIMGQQVVLSELNAGWAALADTNFTFNGLESLFLDSWDGYPAERSRLLSHLEKLPGRNTVVLTGDIHTALAFEVADHPVVLRFQPIPGIGNVPLYSPSPIYDPVSGAGAVTVEMVAPSLTSANFDENFSTAMAAQLEAQINRPIVPFPGFSLGNPNPHMKYADLSRHGYFILDVQPDTVQSDWYFSDISRPETEENPGASFALAHGKAHLLPQAESQPAKRNPPAPAPLDPPVLSPDAVETPGNIAVLSVSPLPFSGEHHLHYALQQTARVTISCFDAGGREMGRFFEGQLGPGLYSQVVDGSSWPAGWYLYRIQADQDIRVVKVLKGW